MNTKIVNRILQIERRQQRKKTKTKKECGRNKSRWKRENKRGIKKKNKEMKREKMPPIVVMTLARV